MAGFGAVVVLDVGSERGDYLLMWQRDVGEGRSEAYLDVHAGPHTHRRCAASIVAFPQGLHVQNRHRTEVQPVGIIDFRQYKVEKG